MNDDQTWRRARQLTDLAARYARGEQISHEELLDYQRSHVAQLEAMAAMVQTPGMDARCTSAADKAVALAQAQLALLEGSMW